jgi:cytochrome b561
MEIGRRNIRFGWIWILVGLLVGAVMGMWSFNGPMPSPVGDYASLPRRMLRLSHIAFIALAFMNILYGYEIEKTKLTQSMKRLGSGLMISGAVLMPLFLLSAVFYEQLKYLTAISATLLIVAVAIITIGLVRKKA